MRNKFAEAIYEIGKKDSKICALVADISPAGSMLDFQKDFPNRFINTGVSEQSMIGIAAGLALRGMRPFCYTIASFSLFRPFEFIRVDLCYQNLPVTVIGMGAGLIYSTLGSTHHSAEDIAVASTLPNMQVIAPCDPSEMKLATTWCAKYSKGPVYMRLGKAGEPDLTQNAEEFKFGKIRYLHKGNKIAIITYGITMNLASQIKKHFNDKGLNPSLISNHTIKPLDVNGLKKILKNYEKIIVLEESIPHGGLSSRLKEIAYDNGIISKLDCYTLKDKFINFYGNHQELLEKHNFSFSDIIKNYK